MANFPKKKTRNNALGGAIPPTVDEIKNNLNQPEHAPAEPVLKEQKKERTKTKKIIPLSSKITKSFDDDLRLIAFKEKKTLGEILEESFYAKYKNNLK